MNHERREHSAGQRSRPPHNASSNRPQERRGPSGAWSRLKPMTIDPLEEYGLPSKGETRLHNFSNQEAYYTMIVQRYTKFCAATSGGEQLEAAFATLSLQQDMKRIDARSSQTGSGASDLPIILMSMRKLREGILGSRRYDAFAQRAYIFIIHASILTRQWESYQPALLHLLYRIHPRVPLSPLELQEFTGYHILDLVCRQNEIMEAITVKRVFNHKSRRVLAVLHSLIHDDWPRFWRTRRAVDGYQRALMQFAEERIRLHTLKCIGRSYLNADRGYIERCTNQTWSELVKSGVGWQLQDNDQVAIKKPKSKP